MQKQQYKRHVKNALDAIEVNDTDIAKRQIDIAIKAYEKNARLKGQETKTKRASTAKAEKPRDKTGLQHTALSKNTSNDMKIPQPTNNTYNSTTEKGAVLKQRLIVVGVVSYVLTLVYAVWLNLEFVADLGYGTNDQWLLVGAELSQAIFMIAGLHWWLGARGYEFPIALGVLSLSVWMLIDRLIIAGQYSRAAEQLQAAKDAAIQNLMNVM